MSRHGFHTFTMPDAPVFGWEDPFFDDPHSGDRAPTLSIPPTKAPTPFGAPATFTEETN